MHKMNKVLITGYAKFRDNITNLACDEHRVSWRVVHVRGMRGAMGAIASGGARVLNESVLAQLDDSDEALALVTETETRELERREAEYRDGRPAPELRGKMVILVDDGLATGATMRAAVKALRERGVARCVV